MENRIEEKKNPEPNQVHTRTNNNNNNDNTKANYERVYYFNDGLLGFEVCVWYSGYKDTKFHSQNITTMNNNNSTQKYIDIT